MYHQMTIVEYSWAGVLYPLSTRANVNFETFTMRGVNMRLNLLAMTKCIGMLLVLMFRRIALAISWDLVSSLMLAI